MRRVVLLLVALLLVNLPFVREHVVDQRVDHAGREVSATVLDTATIRGRHFVDYRLPREVDPRRRTYTARIDSETYRRARDTRRLAVRVVPGSPAQNRPDGAVGSSLFGVVAVVGDLILGLLAFGLWRRRRRWRLHEVVAVGEHLVTLKYGDAELTATAPEGWLRRIRPGQRVPGSLHLLADGDVVPAERGVGLVPVAGATYVVHGRVLDAVRDTVVLDVGERRTVLVETGPHRIRADLRETAEVTGELTFAPSRRT